MAYKNHSDVIKYYKKWRVVNREKLRRKARARYHKNTEKEKARHFAWTQKNKKHLRVYMEEFRKIHRETINRRAKEYRARLKERVFQHYGGYVCVCCGITEKRFLTIDHIIKSGKSPSERKTLYSWIKQKNFPVGFRVLCFNCNLGRDKNKGICPHTESLKEK